MSCSKTSTINYLVSKNLVKPNLELYTPLPTQRLLSTIERLTNTAKTKYGVDLGDLFRIRFRNIDVGNYVNMGSSSTVTRIKLEPNDAAFEAIDRSDAQEYLRQQREQDKKRFSQYTIEYSNIQEEGNFIMNEDGEISVPTSLPKINVRC